MKKLWEQFGVAVALFLLGACIFLLAELLSLWMIINQ